MCTVQSLGKTICQFLLKLNIERHDPAISFLGIVKSWKQLLCPSEENGQIGESHTINYYTDIEKKKL